MAAWDKEEEMLGKWQSQERMHGKDWAGPIWHRTDQSLPEDAPPQPLGHAQSPVGMKSRKGLVYDHPGIVWRMGSVQDWPGEVRETFQGSAVG